MNSAIRRWSHGRRIKIRVHVHAARAARRSQRRRWSRDRSGRLRGGRRSVLITDNIDTKCAFINEEPMDALLERGPGVSVELQQRLELWVRATTEALKTGNFKCMIV